MLKTERSDYGKAVRKAYERGEIRFKRMEVKQYTARLDGVRNTITGVQKDNWIYMWNDTVMNVGNTTNARKNFDDPQEGRMYHPKGVAPTIRSVGGGKYLVLICVKRTK